MKVKEYKVYPKGQPDFFYFIDAPSKRIAKWCGANLHNNTYLDFLSAQDMKAEQFKCEEERTNEHIDCI